MSRLRFFVITLSLLFIPMTSFAATFPSYTFFKDLESLGQSNVVMIPMDDLVIPVALPGGLTDECLVNYNSPECKDRKFVDVLCALTRTPTDCVKQYESFLNSISVSEYHANHGPCFMVLLDAALANVPPYVASYMRYEVAGTLLVDLLKANISDAAEREAFYYEIFHNGDSWGYSCNRSRSGGASNMTKVIARFGYASKACEYLEDIEKGRVDITFTLVGETDYTTAANKLLWGTLNSAGSTAQCAGVSFDTIYKDFNQFTSDLRGLKTDLSLSDLSHVKFYSTYMYGRLLSLTNALVPGDAGMAAYYFYLNHHGRLEERRALIKRLGCALCLG